LAQVSPETIHKLILVNSTPLADSADRLKNRRQAIKLLEQLPERFIAMAIQNLFAPESLEKLQPTIDILKSKAIKLDPKGVIACVKGMMARPDSTATLTSLKAPKVIIASLKDPIIDSQLMANISLKAGAQFAVLPGGHMSPFEQPKQLNKILQHYIN
jgi:pimeloyl-ACP methyl ester carboxylesterase